MHYRQKENNFLGRPINKRESVSQAKKARGLLLKIEFERRELRDEVRNVIYSFFNYATKTPARVPLPFLSLQAQLFREQLLHHECSYSVFGLFSVDRSLVCMV